MNENERKAYLDFMYNPGNIGKCKACPENRGEDGHEANGHPCGQQNCWVAVHCADKALREAEDEDDKNDG